MQSVCRVITLHEEHNVVTLCLKDVVCNWQHNLSIAQLSLIVAFVGLRHHGWKPHVFVFRVLRFGFKFFY